MMPCLSEPPYDVVVFLLDDMRCDQLPVLEQTLEKLKEHSVVFTRAYVTTPLCCPERASFLSGGWRPSETGVLHNDPPQGGSLDFSDSRSMPVRILEAGIPTALMGKYLNHYSELLPYIPPGWSSWAAIHEDSPWEDFSFATGSSTAQAPARASRGQLRTLSSERRSL